MTAQGFVEKTTLALSQFLKTHLNGGNSFAIHVQCGCPNETEFGELNSLSLERGTFLSRLTGERPLHIYLVPYHVARIQTGRSTQRVPSEIEENGVSKIQFTREPEAYRVKYLILGPSLLTSDGQRLVSALIGVLFDQSQLELETQETVRLVEPNEQNDEVANQMLKAAGISLSPLYLLHAELKISTSTVLAKDNVVHARHIHLGARMNGNETK